MSGRVARFNVRARLDGQHELTVELKVTAGEEDAVMSVRPKHSRRIYTALLSEVALIVAARDAKRVAMSNGIAVPRPRKGS